MNCVVVGVWPFAWVCMCGGFLWKSVWLGVGKHQPPNASHENTITSAVARAQSELLRISRRSSLDSRTDKGSCGWPCGFELTQSFFVPIKNTVAIVRLKAIINRRLGRRIVILIKMKLKNSDCALSKKIRR